MNKVCAKCGNNFFYLNSRNRKFCDKCSFWVNYKNRPKKFVHCKTHRRCYICKKIKLLNFDNFYHHRTGGYGFDYRCKSCLTIKFSRPQSKKYLKEYWRKLSKEKRQIYTKRGHLNRYVREKNALGKFTMEQWGSLLDQHNHKCALCFKKEPFIGQRVDHLTIDHIIPLSKGGTNFIENIQPLCFSCNSKKRATVPLGIIQ